MVGDLPYIVNTTPYGFAPWQEQMTRRGTSARYTDMKTSKAPKSQPKARESTRLGVDDWVRGALDLLAEEGVDGVRIEVLAKRLHVTKGSFYWHFKDRNGLLRVMLDDWRRRATLDIINRIESGDEPPQKRLQTLLHLPFRGGRSKRGADVELSIRLWGRTDTDARATLAEIDKLRLRYISKLFTEVGFAKEEAETRAVLAYAYMRVAVSLIDGEADMIERCERLLALAVA